MEERRIPTQKPISESVTIPLAEYAYLHRLDALMDVLLMDMTFCNSATVKAVKETVMSMRMVAKAEPGAAE